MPPNVHEVSQRLAYLRIFIGFTPQNLHKTLCKSTGNQENCHLASKTSSIIPSHCRFPTPIAGHHVFLIDWSVLIIGIRCKLFSWLRLHTKLFLPTIHQVFEREITASSARNRPATKHPLIALTRSFSRIRSRSYAFFPVYLFKKIQFFMKFQEFILIFRWKGWKFMIFTENQWNFLEFE